MKAHDLAKLLLALPNYDVVESSEGITEWEPRIGEILDPSAPEFKPFAPNQTAESYCSWREQQPKKTVILI